MFALLFACVAAATGCAAPAGPPGEPDSLRRGALQRSLQAFGAAFLQADAEALDTFLVAGYLHTNGGSGTVLDKPGWLDYIRGRRADLHHGRLRIDRYETLGLAIRWYPTAAVVSSQVVSEGTQDGVPFSSRLQVTQVWILLGEQWRRAAFHDSPVPPN
jgi:hypothetical protein